MKKLSALYAVIPSRGDGEGPHKGAQRLVGFIYVGTNRGRCQLGLRVTSWRIERFLASLGMRNLER